MHRFAVHYGIRRKARSTCSRDDDDAFASVEVLDIAEVTDIGVVGAIAHHGEGVQAILQHVATQALDPLMILRDVKRKMHPWQTILERIGHTPPAIRHLRTITCAHILSPCWMAPRHHGLVFGKLYESGTGRAAHYRRLPRARDVMAPIQPPVSSGSILQR